MVGSMVGSMGGDSMVGSMVGEAVVYHGAARGQQLQVQLDQTSCQLQVIVFYRGDWEPSSAALLSSFSSLSEQFSACQAALYGCSTDCLSSHLAWTRDFHLAFPLLSDRGGGLAARWGSCSFLLSALSQVWAAGPRGQGVQARGGRPRQGGAPAGARHLGPRLQPARSLLPPPRLADKQT